MTKKQAVMEEPGREQLPPAEVVEVARRLAAGLIVRGVIQRRIRRHVGENKVEVVTYTLGPRFAEVEHWEPKGVYHPLGAQVEWEVGVSVFQGRWVLQLPKAAEEF